MLYSIVNHPVAAIAYLSAAYRLLTYTAIDVLIYLSISAGNQ